MVQHLWLQSIILHLKMWTVHKSDALYMHVPECITMFGPASGSVTRNWHSSLICLLRMTKTRPQNRLWRKEGVMVQILRLLKRTQRERNRVMSGGFISSSSIDNEFQTHVKQIDFDVASKQQWQMSKWCRLYYRGFKITGFGVHSEWNKHEDQEERSTKELYCCL